MYIMNHRCRTASMITVCACTIVHILPNPYYSSILHTAEACIHTHR